MKIRLALAALAVASSAAHAVGSSGPDVDERVQSAHDYIAKKDWDRAMRELQAALREEPRNPDVHNMIGYTYRVRPNPDLAKSFEHYHLALKYNPKHKATHEYIGEAYLMDRKPAQAEKHLAELEAICGNRTCAEYQELAKAIADYKAKN